MAHDRMVMRLFCFCKPNALHDGGSWQSSRRTEHEPIIAYLRRFGKGKICHALGRYMEHSPEGDNIRADIDKSGGDTAVGKDIAQSTARAGDVHVNFPPYWHPAQAHGQGEGLPMADVQRFDEEIRWLREKIGDMNVLLIEVKTVMRSDTESREERNKLQERMINTFVDTFQSEIAGMIARLTALEIRAAQFEGQRGKRDPLQIIGGAAIIVLLAVIAGVQIFS